MAQGKIEPLISAGDKAEAVRADQAIDHAVNEPANANQRITDGVAAGVEEFNKAAAAMPYADPPSAVSNQERIERLEATVKALCRAQMTLPRQADFKD